MFEPLSVALKVGVVPATGFEVASRSLMVMVELETPSLGTGPDPVIVEVAIEALPALKTTVPPGVLIGEVMLKVLVSALLDFKVHVETPEAFPREQVLYTLLPPVFVAEKVGKILGTAFEFASFKVMVMVDVLVPFAETGPVPVMVEVAVAGEPGTKMTLPPALTTGELMLKVLVSAWVEVKVQVETPRLLVAEHA